jgi:hypothetical protein
LSSCLGLNATHQSWLTNVLNRAAAGLVVESGRPLYQEDLANHLREHFSDLLDSLNPAEDEEEEEDDDDGQVS